MCAITETNSCTAAKTIRSFDDGGGQECSCRAATSVAVMMAWNIAHAKVIRPYTSKSCRSRVWHSYKSPWRPHYTEVHLTAGHQTEPQHNPSEFRLHRLLLQVIKKSSWTPLSSTDGESITLVKLHRRWLLWKLPHHPSPSWRQLYNYLVLKVWGFLDKGQRLVGDIQEVIIEAVSWQTIRWLAVQTSPRFDVRTKFFTL